MQYQLLENCKEKGNGNDRCKVESIRVRTLETDVQMLRRELEDANTQRAEAETQIESLQYALTHIKESNVKELERKYESEVKEMKHMIYLLTNHKKEAMRLQKEANGSNSERRIVQLEKECEVLHNDNYRLSQEIQYLEFKLKVVFGVESRASQGRTTRRTWRQRLEKRWNGTRSQHSSSTMKDVARRWASWSCTGKRKRLLYTASCCARWTCCVKSTKSTKSNPQKSLANCSRIMISR
eukprot:TRINITY_DN5281_c0_g2_i1.p1 TRINITY_DN5281_c0_g2~~TRINITY_DN5281_c0_g2_i1.p1  ORF type:complete len:239 (-),score=16.32 TRINITY_DN5281_c0_g2_i1:172-888(-)